jgi:glucosamine--fructose-6-phosphate aminotransferase (isomerizing)
MTKRGAHTLAEILSQPAVWADALDAFESAAAPLKALWDAHTPSRVIFTGCGSTHYLAMAGAALLQLLVRRPCEARPASELLLFPELVYAPQDRVLLVAVSRSGTTTETVEAVRAFSARAGDQVIAVTCDGHRDLAALADICLVADAAQEQSIAQTRSFTSMMLLVQAMTAHFAGQDVARSLGRAPDVVERILDEHHDLARALGEDLAIDRFFFLGSGSLYGIASEAMLKMKEMSLSYSEAFHTLEFRHGPMSMVDDRTLVVGLLSEQARKQEIAVLRQMQGFGAHILAIAEDDEDIAGADWCRAAIPLRSGMPAWARTVLYLPVLQLMAYYRSMARGHDPDRPAKLDAVVSLDAADLREM